MDETLQAARAKIPFRRDHVHDGLDGRIDELRREEDRTHDREREPDLGAHRHEAERSVVHDEQRAFLTERGRRAECIAVQRGGTRPRSLEARKEYKEKNVQPRPNVTPEDLLSGVPLHLQFTPNFNSEITVCDDDPAYPRPPVRSA